ncbi:hypothetical protein ACQ5SO_11010 [Rhodovulum sp. DZ06]|uniref:hypothetical protein n=1 Tax=Rhodovulum sp. DZ06 TaxID=3425126 RepID=UPI003D3594BF
MLMSHIRSLVRPMQQQDGAVTADFVVLTAGVIIIFLLIIEPIYNGSQSMVGEINDELIKHASSVWQF